jgi:chromosomal replication initiation ATPase DnaA
MDLHLIIQAAAEATGVPPAIITSRRRGTSAVTDARTIAIAISAQLHPHLTRTDLAQTVGRTNHGTTLYHLARAAKHPHIPPLIAQALSHLP